MAPPVAWWQPGQLTRGRSAQLGAAAVTIAVGATLGAAVVIGGPSSEPTAALDGAFPGVVTSDTSPEAFLEGLGGEADPGPRSPESSDAAIVYVDGPASVVGLVTGQQPQTSDADLAGSGDG